MLRVLFISDIRLFREGIAEMLARDDRVSLVDAAPSLDAAVERLRSAEADTVLVDLAMRDAVGAIRTISRRFPRSRVVALGLSERKDRIIDCAEAGISGFVPRESSLNQLVESLHRAVRGEVRCSPRAAGVLLSRVARLARTQVSELDELTLREIEIVRLVAKGLTNKEIGSRLHIEQSTVKTHLHNILQKLHVRRRGEAVARLRSAGWLDRDRSRSH